MKKAILKFSVLLLCGVLAFTACKKKTDTTPTTTNDSSTQTTSANDLNDYARESNQSASDADVALSASGSSGARMAASSPTAITVTSLQGATVDTSNLQSQSVIVINYTSTTGAGTKRVGYDSVQIIPAGAKWHTQGTKLILKYKFTITRFDNKTLVFQGQDTVTNVNGGNYEQLVTGQVSSYVTNHVGGATLTFDDGSQRKWWHSRTKTATDSLGSIIVINVNGSGSINGNNNVDTWGVNRNNETFYAQTTSPIQWQVNTNNLCSHWYDPVSGVYYHKGTGSGLTVTFGVDASGNQSGPVNGCPYGFKLGWTYKGTAEQLVISY